MPGALPSRVTSDAAREGDLLVYSAGVWRVLEPGTSGDVLTTQGAGALPTWETPASGSSDHAALTSGLSWTASGHVSSTANRVAGFGASSQAVEYGIDSSGGLASYDAGLASLRSADSAAGIAYPSGANTWTRLSLSTDQSFYASSSSALAAYTTTNYGRGLVGVADASAARVALGLVIGSDVQAYSAGLLSLAAQGTTADRYVYTTGADTWAEGVITSWGRGLLDDVDAAAGRTTLGLGNSATRNVGTGSGDVATGDAPGAAQAAAEATAASELAAHAGDDTLHTTGLDQTALSGAFGRFCRIQPAGNSYTADGFTSIITNGTLAEAVSNTRANLQFTAGSTSYGGWRASAINFMRIGHGGKLWFSFQLPSTVSGKRTWIGWASILVGSGATAAGSFAGLLVETTGVAYAVACDGAAQSTTSTTVTVTADTDYYGYVRTSSSGVYVRIAPVGSELPAETAHTTNLPSAGTTLALNCVCYMVGGVSGTFQSAGLSYVVTWS